MKKIINDYTVICLSTHYEPNGLKVVKLSKELTVFPFTSEKLIHYKLRSHFHKQ